MDRNTITDKKLMRYGIYIFVIFLWYGYGTYFKFIGLYFIPLSLLLFRSCLFGKVYRFWKAPLFSPLMLFFCSGIISTILAQNPKESLIFFEKFHLRTFVIYVLVVLLFNASGQLRKLCFVLALSSIAYITLLGTTYYKSLITFGIVSGLSSSAYSVPLLYLLPFIYITIMTSTRKMTRNAWWCAFFLSLMGITFAGGRAALLGMIGMVFIIFIYADRIFKKRVTVAVMVIVVLFSMFADNWRKERYLSLNTSGRDKIFKDYLYATKKHRLFGLGLDDRTMLEFGGNGRKQRMGWKAYKKTQSPHNSYLLIFVKQGLVGLSTYIFLLAFCIISLMRKIYRRPPSTYKFVGVALLSSFVGMYLIFYMATTLIVMPLALLIGITSIYLNLGEDDFKKFKLRNLKGAMG